MTSMKVMDYDIDFPYSYPYDIQKLYMEKVIECLHNRVNGVLESPTGTGKTLCLLAPVSAWLKKQRLGEESVFSESESSISPSVERGMKEWGNKRKSIVWYTARTHSQIAQTIGETRKCDIKGLNIRVLGARDQLCINPEVLNEQESYVKTIKCKELIKSKGCKYYRKLNEDKDFRKYYQPGYIMDIEDLISAGKTCGVCPYYLSKMAVDMADIVFMPYNYVIDKDSRDSNGLHFQGDVIIFDEGHNVPSVCEESYEFSFSSLDLVLGIRNMKDFMVSLVALGQIVNEDEEINMAKHLENSEFLMEVLQKLESGLEDLKVSEELLPVSMMYEFFETAGITTRTVNRINEAVEEFKSDAAKLSLPGNILQTFYILEQVASTIFGSTVRYFDSETIDRSFKWCVRHDPEKTNKCKRVNLYCFNPSFGIRGVLELGVKCIIITSGTLSPLKNFIHELNLPRPITLQNGHIAKKCQVPFIIVGTGVNNVQMNAAFTNRDDPKYVLSLGRTLTNLISSVPDGVLILFSSYTMMQNLKASWESDIGIWKRLNSLKRVFLEPRGKEEFITCMENYKRAIDSGNGAILMGVLRGKISEGMDFKDQYCRAVFIVGVPFPPAMDPRVKGKEVYSESLKVFNADTKNEEKLYSNSYMSVEAMKATNQAIGRVIRHAQDYGAIVLLDYRFCWFKLFRNISRWLRGNAPEEKNFPQTKKILSDFFRDIHLGKLGVPEIRVQRVDGNGCPIPEFISYEEYEHKTSVRAVAPHITVSDRKTSITNIPEFAEENFSGISDLYECNKTKLKSLKSVPTVKKATSVFDAMECTKNAYAKYGELDMDGSTISNGETFKRKNESVKEFSQASKMACLDADSGSETEKKFQVRKFHRFKIKPFSKSDLNEPESTVVGENFTNSYNRDINTRLANEATNNEEYFLKIKLINYFKSAKDILSEEEVEKLKRCSFRYMKGEQKLSDIIPVFDQFLNSSQKRQIFSGFSICVKSSDREEWKGICQMRNLS